MRLLRETVVVPLGLAVAWLLGRFGADLLARGPARVDDVVALGAAATGATLALWYAVTALALVLARLAALSRRTARVARGLRAAVGRLGAPALRRAAVVGVGAGLALSAAPAGADAPVTVGASAGPHAPALVGAATAPPSSLADDDVVPLDLRPGLSPVDELVSHPPEPAEEDLPDEMAPAPTDPVATQPLAPGEQPGDGQRQSADGEAAQRPGAARGGETAAQPGATPGGADGRSTPTDTPSQDDHATGAPPQQVDRHDSELPETAMTTAAADRTGGAGAGSAASAEVSYVVRQGDSLWAIAGAHLGGGATTAEIADEWPRWYETNRAVVGADPHLIHPGQGLLAPDRKDTP